MHPSVIVLTKKIDNGILLLNDRDCAKNAAIGEIAA